MKKCTRHVLALLVVTSLFALVGCTGGSSGDDGNSPEQTAEQTAGQVTVLEVANETVDVATQRLEDLGLVPQRIDVYNDVAAVDQVLSQVPPAGTSVPKGTDVAILVSLGPAPQGTATAKVPSVVGKSRDAATAALADVNLQAASFEMDGSGKPVQEVVYQTPAGGREVSVGTQVAVIVSSGK